MSTRLTVPKSAHCVAEARGELHKGPRAGATWVLKLWEGSASKGYASDYKHVPHRWVSFNLDGEPTERWQYSGRRLPKAKQHYTDALDSFGAWSRIRIIQPLEGRND